MQLTDLHSVSALQDRYGLPGMPVSSDTVAVFSVAELDAWYVAFRGGSTLAVGGRYESRGGKYFGLGGLVWQLNVIAPGGVRLTVVTESAEDEVLPDVAVVRAIYPHTPVAAALGQVAA